MASQRSRRKALLLERGVTMRDIAMAVPCSDLTVSNVIAGRQVYETPKTKRVKALIAERVGLTVDELWPDEEVAA